MRARVKLGSVWGRFGVSSGADEPVTTRGCACLGYGICAGVLLHVLSVDMAPAFGVAAFLLSFVPEVGAIVAMLLPAPVILFDSRLEAPFFTLFVATSAQLGLKFVFANVVEAWGPSASNTPSAPST